MGNDVTKADLAAVNKRIDSAAKAFTALSKEVQDNQSASVDTANFTIKAAKEFDAQLAATLGKQIAALEARVAALEKK